MYRFEKDTEYAVFTGDNVKLSFAYLVEKLEESYYVHFPSLDVHFYTKNSDEIPESAQESLESYFNYWYKIKNSEFLEHMLSLGFSIRSEKSTKSTSRAKITRGRRRKLNEEFRLEA